MCLLKKLRSWFSEMGGEASPADPCFFVRVCRKKTELLTIVNEACNPNNDDTSDLVDRVLTFVLDGSDGEKSVYGVVTNDPLDPGHALAVIAEGIAQESFVKKKKTRCSRCTVILPASEILSFFESVHTPQNNTNFSPADKLHHDFRPLKAMDFAVWLLAGIRIGTVKHVPLSNEKKTYRLQARLAYSTCLGQFGSLSESSPPNGWRNGETLSASEQIAVLRYLAGPDALCAEQ